MNNNRIRFASDYGAAEAAQSVSPGRGYGKKFNKTQARRRQRRAFKDFFRDPENGPDKVHNKHYRTGNDVC